MAIKNGTSGSDLLYGSSLADTIFGGNGNDFMFGGGGTDLIFGGAGEDYAVGGNGADTIAGGGGDDSLIGENEDGTGTGNDTLNGDQGNDDLYGGTADDRLFGGVDQDELFGGVGQDTLRGDDGSDVLNGGYGSDYMNGGAGNDTAVFSGSLDDATVFGTIGVDVTVTVISADGNDTLVSIEGLDFADDDEDNLAPTITETGYGAVTEDGVGTTSGAAGAFDPEDDNLTFSGPTTGTYGNFAIDGGGSWTYTLNNADPDTNALDSTDTVSELITITVSDGDTIDTAVVSITVVGANDAPSIGTVGTRTLTEDNAASVATATATASDPDDPVTFSGDASGTYGTFDIGPGGVWTYTLNNADTDTNTLDAGQTSFDVFTVTAGDGTTQDTELLTITVVGANDAPSIGTVGTAGTLTEDNATSVAGGTATANDPDDLVTFSGDASGTYGTFDIDDGGTWSYTLNNADPDTNALDAGQTSFDVFTITAGDGTTQDSELLTITVVGANDAPTIGTAGLEGSVTEDAAASQVSGTVAVADPDDALSEQTFSGDASGTYGTFDVGANGTWTYTLLNGDPQTDALTEGEVVSEVFTITATDNNGASDTGLVTITVVGDANDAPEIGTLGADSTEALTEDNAISVAGGTAAASDPEGDSLTFSANSSGTYGTFDIDDGGTWSYTLDNTDPDTNGLDSTDTVSELVTVTATDGAATVTGVFTLTVVGANDAPTIGTAGLEGSVTEDAAASQVSGTVAVADPDDSLGEQTFSGDASGTYGTFDVGANGAWTYTLLNGDPQTDALTEGEVVSEVFTITATDNNGASDTGLVTITVVGDANDAPTVGTDGLTGSVTEDTTISLASGTASATDPDDAASEVSFSGDASGTYGTFDIGANGGWTYTLLNGDPETNALDSGETSFDVFTVTATDGDTASDTELLTITVVGANDAPSIGTAGLAGSVTEAGTTVVGVSLASGTASAPDPDDLPSEVTFSGDASGTYGTFDIGPNGAWTYTLNNADTDTNALTAGQTSFDVFTITASDGAVQDTDLVTITVRGSNDEPDQETFNGANNSGTLDPNPNIWYGGTGDDSASGDNGNDTLFGGDGNDSLIGDNGNDTIFGNANADTLDGASGNDFVYGGAGSDTVKGGSGNDVLYGGTGIDTLTGDGGVDIFAYLSPSEGADSITDFSAADDFFAFDIDGFPGPGTWTPGALPVDNFGTGQDGDNYFIYTGGVLFYDADAIAGGSVAIATVSALTAADIILF